MSFWETFYKTCKEHGTSPNAVCKEIGLSNAAATGWKNGTLPKADILVQLADVLDVSVDFLLGHETKKDAPGTDARSAIIDKVTHLSDSDLDRVLGYLEALEGK